MPIDKTAIFEDLKALLLENTHNLTIVREEPGRIDVAGDKPVQIGNQIKEKMFFASVIIQKSYVGFYFFPIYTHPDEFADTPPEIRRCLKGKSCFHIKEQDDLLYEQLRDLLTRGLEVYQAEEWI